MASLLHLGPQRCPFDDLNARTPRIGDVGKRVPVCGFPDGLVEFDSFRLDLLDESRVILDVETDVVEYPPSRLCLTRIGLGETNLYAG